MMVDTVEAPDPTTVVFRLKFATSAFLPALADPFNWIYKKEILDKDPRWYEKNILGSGPFKFVEYRDRPVDQGRAQPRLLPQGAALSRRLHRHLCRQAGGAGRGDPRRPRRDRVPRLAALGARRARRGARRQDHRAGERLELRQRSSTPNHKKKPFDDAAGAPRADPGDRPLARRAGARRRSPIVHTVGGIVFPGSPLAATKEELEQIAGFWPDIEKSRAEAKRLLKEAGAEGLSFELLNRNVDQPYKYVGTWLIDEWSKIGLKVTQRVVPTGPWFEAMRSGNFDVVLDRQLPRAWSTRCSTCSRYLPGSVYAGELRQFRGPRRRSISTTRCCARPIPRSSGR